MDLANQASDHFINGYNCCQAILLTFGPQMGLDKETLLKMGSGFGGGIGRTGQMCGAVLGAITILNLQYGNTDPKNAEAKKQMFDIVQIFINQYKEKQQSTTCNDLIGHDICTANGHKMATEENVFRTKCPGFIKDAAIILEKMLQL